VPPLATIVFSGLNIRAVRGDYGGVLRHGSARLITGELLIEFGERRRPSAATTD